MLLDDAVAFAVNDDELVRGVARAVNLVVVRIVAESVRSRSDRDCFDERIRLPVEY